MAIQRWEPFRELRQMENTMNRLWRGFGALGGFREGTEDWNIAIDVIQKPEEIIVKASVPGVKPEDIDVTVEDNVLALKAERKSEVEEGDSSYLVRERTAGSYYRALRLPDSIDTNRIKSEYEHGVLTVTLSRAEEKKPRRIKVSVKSGTKEIEAGGKKSEK
jgi:HSP20 family protein